MSKIEWIMKKMNRRVFWAGGAALMGAMNVRIPSAMGADDLNMPTRVLQHHHRVIQDIAEELHYVENIQHREAGFVRLQNRLDAHMEVEERIFYPALSRIGPVGAAFSAEGVADHARMRADLRRLQKLPLGGEDWKAAFKQLTEETNEHVREEERDMFVRASAMLPEGEAARMAEQIHELWDNLTHV